MLVAESPVRTSPGHGPIERLLLPWLPLVLENSTLNPPSLLSGPPSLLPGPTSCFPALPGCCPAFKAPNATTLGKTSASLCPSSSYVSDMSDTVTSQAVGPGETCQLASGRQTGLIRTHSSHLPRARKVSKTPVDRNQGAYHSAWHNLQCWYWRRAWAQP